jgi:hypothetical protein
MNRDAFGVFSYAARLSLLFKRCMTEWAAKSTCGRGHVIGFEEIAHLNPAALALELRARLRASGRAGGRLRTRLEEKPIPGTR